MLFKNLVIFVCVELLLNVFALEAQKPDVHNKNLYQVIRNIYERNKRHSPYHWGHVDTDCPYPLHDATPHSNYWGPSNIDWQHHPHNIQPQYWGPHNTNWQYPHEDTHSQYWGPENTNFYPQQSTDDTSDRIGGTNMKYISQNTSLRQENQEPLENNTQTTTEAPTTETNSNDNLCDPYNPPKPNFATPGRRISEAKCYEYIWDITTRETKQNRLHQCFRQDSFHVAVIGGRRTEPGEFPHMAAVGWKATKGTWIFKCGGSLISSKFVLTAGHCIKASPRDDSISDTVPKLVRLGDRNILDKPKSFEKPIDVNISRIISHPLYKSPIKYNDIALFELAKELVFNINISPACLWTNFDVSSVGPKAIVTGWGVIDSKRVETTPELQAATVDLIDSGTCKKILRPSCNRLWCGLIDNQICAGTLAGGVDTCQGDSGGPLQTKINLPNIKTAVHYVIGVTSFGIKCGRANSPGVYSRVSSYLDWIESVVWPENNNFGR